MQTICRGSKCAVHCVANDTNVDHAVHMTNQGGRFCLVAFPKKPVNFNLGYLAVSTFIFMKLVGKEGMLLTELRLFFAMKQVETWHVGVDSWPCMGPPLIQLSDAQ